MKVASPVPLNRYTEGHTHMENAKQLLSRIHRAACRVQNSAGVPHIATIAQNAHALTPTQLVDACSVVLMRATLEMAIARALGDRVVGRVDLLVLAQIRDLLGADVAQAVRVLVETADGRVLENNAGNVPEHIASDWPASFPPALPTKRAPRAPWYVRVTRSIWAAFLAP
jgi:hypothetical protein